MIPAGERLGDLVIEADHLRKGYGNHLMEDLSFKVPPGGIVGVIGPNGAGKTTLFRMITGDETPDGGELRVGNPFNSDSSTSQETPWIMTAPSEEISQGEAEIDLANAKSKAELMSARSTSADPTNKRKSDNCQAANATACISRKCFDPARMSFYSTNRPTT